MPFNGFGLAPRNINSLLYTGSGLFFAPALPLNHAPTTTDLYPIITFAINKDIPHVSGNTNGDLWYLARYQGQAKNPEGQAIWLKLSTGGSGPMLEITGDDSVIVFPNSITGNINLNGRIVANGTHASGGTGQGPLFTQSPSINTEHIDLQLSTAIAATDATLAKVGVSVFNSSEFTVDANGFVSLVGGGAAIEKITVDNADAPGTQPVVSNAGNIILKGAIIQPNQSIPIRTESDAANTIHIQIQATTKSTNGAKTLNNAGSSSFDSAAFNVDAATGFVSLVGGFQPAIQTLSDDADPNPTPGSVVTPFTNGNIQLAGHVFQSDGTTHIPTTVGGSNLININPMSASRWIVDSKGFNGTHTTIQSAINASTSGDTIYVLSGTYTEDLTLKAGVSITTYDQGLVTIVGKSTFTGTGTAIISNCTLQTNADFCVVVSGTNASVLSLQACSIICTNHTGISYTNSNGSSNIAINNCTGNTTTTGIAIYSHSGADSINFIRSHFSNTGASTTANTNSSGTVALFNGCVFNAPLSCSSAAVIAITDSAINTSATNVTAITTAGTGRSNIYQSQVYSGSATAISVGAGTILDCFQNFIASSNNAVISGAGTLNYDCLSFFFNTSPNAITVTTQTGGLLIGGKTQNPSAGLIGEIIENRVTNQALTSNMQTGIASIILTPGIWDVSAIATTTATGGTALAQAFIVGISTSNNSQTGTLGQDFWQSNFGAGFGVLSGCVPPIRVTVTTNTTYWLTVLSLYSSTTSPTNGRITAIRAG